jgi:hypothetical protein
MLSGTDPEPVPPDEPLTVIQVGRPVVDHAQPLVVVTFTVTEPPAGGAEKLAGLIA